MFSIPFFVQFMKQENEKYCTECGELIKIRAEICPKCVISNQISSEITEQRNKWITCLLLRWFLGVFGVHRFYTGHTSWSNTTFDTWRMWNMVIN